MLLQSCLSVTPPWTQTGDECCASMPTMKIPVEEIYQTIGIQVHSVVCAVLWSAVEPFGIAGGPGEIAHVQ